MTRADLLALIPVLILALGSAALLLLGAWWPRRRPLLRLATVIALAGAAAAAFYTPPTTEIAGMFGAGLYARFFTVLWSLVAALTLLLSVRYGDERHFAGGEYGALVLFGAAGMALLSSATSLVGFFLGLEAFTLVLYILIAFHKDDPLGAEAGLKYLVLGAVATGFLAFGIALIYTAAGTFHLPEAMAGLAAGASMRPLGLLGWGMLLLVIGFKVSLVPFHLWTPDVYQGSPAPVAGLLSTGSKGAVFAALVTVFAGLPAGGDLAPILWLLAALSMLVGTLSALRQENVKRMLAYSSVVHMGYVVIALLAGQGAGDRAVVFYLVAYAAANIGAFGVLASLSDRGGEPQTNDDLRGIGWRYPFRCAALAVFLLSLAGIPPTAGFVGKFAIFWAAIEAGYGWLAILGIFASLVSLYYYLRVIVLMFMSYECVCEHARGGPAEHTALALCLAVALYLGIYPGPLLELIATIVPP
ncbi:MAG: NADH-quinone oxidoreductase subunit N [Desulfuromonadales bacterium]|nr:NADH-quinone oxidoreductase subunit N [Desulfuromonadales bacterium]